MAEAFRVPLVAALDRASVIAGGLNMGVANNEYAYYIGADVDGVCAALYVNASGNVAIIAAYRDDDNHSYRYDSVPAGRNHTGEMYHTDATTGYQESIALSGPVGSSYFVSSCGVFSDAQSAKNAIRDLQLQPQTEPITYRLTNCSAPSAPTEAVPGTTVTVTLSPDQGFSFVNPSTDVYVTNNGTVVQSTLNGNVLTFTMP